MKNFHCTFNEWLWKRIVNSTLPSREQSFPENPQRHLHLKPSELLLQVPPFLQGFFEHGSINDSKLYCGLRYSLQLSPFLMDTKKGTIKQNRTKRRWKNSPAIGPEKLMNESKWMNQWMGEWINGWMDKWMRMRPPRHKGKVSWNGLPEHFQVFWERSAGVVFMLLWHWHMLPFVHKNGKRRKRSVQCYKKIMT